MSALMSHTPGVDRTQNVLDEIRRDGHLAAASIRAAVQAGPAPPAMFKRLVALGRRDLSAARLYEGHVNALQLVVRFGSAEQVERAISVADGGGLLGTWGADAPQSPARVHDNRLTGAKVFASGLNRVVLAVVAAKNADDKTQLFLLDLTRHSHRTDPTWWQAIGMEATVSGAVSLDGLLLEQQDILGAAGQYESQPFFGAGAIRFVSAHLGGALAVFDATRNHLRSAQRLQDPHQAARLGVMAADLDAAFSFVASTYQRLAPEIDWTASRCLPERAVLADLARVHVEEAARRTLDLAIRCVGCAGYMETHPLCRATRDLSVYLCQPAPDAARVRAGIAVGGGDVNPGFDDD